MSDASMNLEAARDLLPWYATGALDDEQVRAVETALRVHPVLVRELAEFRALQTQVGKMEAEEPAFRPELLNDMHRRIDAYEQERRAKAPSLLARLGDSVRNLFAMPLGVRIALAGQALAIAVLVGVLVSRQPVDQVSHVAGGNDGLAAQAVMTLVFQPETSAEDMQRLLESIDAQIVSGPTSEDVYALALKDATTIDRALETLRTRSDVVRLANKRQ